MADEEYGLIEEATRQRQLGGWRLAEILYRKVLSADPQNHSALYGLGMTKLAAAGEKKCGAEQAIGYLAIAVGLLPSHPAYQFAYGQALQITGDLAHAVQAYQAAFALVSTSALVATALVDALGALARLEEAQELVVKFADGVDHPAVLYCALARVLSQHWQLKAAEQAFDQALGCDERCIEAWTGRGHVRLRQWAFEGAFSDAQQAHELAPGQAAPLTLLAAVWRAKGDLEQAVECCRAALDAAPESVDARAQLATLLDLQGHHAQAEDLFRQVLAQAPHRQDALYNLGGCLMAQDRPQEAAEIYRQAVAQKPEWRDGWSNLGASLLACGDNAQAEAAFRAAVDCPGDQPGLGEARYNLAWAQLIQGDYANGWETYEARWDLYDFSSPKRLFPVPLWDGQSSRVGGIYLHAEQGMGDCIQMLRLVARVREKIAPVVLEVPAALYDLACGVAGADVVVQADYSRPGYLSHPCGCHAPLMSLPYLLRLSLDTVPTSVPYLAPQGESILPFAVAQWAEKNHSQMRVGVVWAGAASNKIDRFRSLSQENVAPLWSVPEIAWASLQVGPRAGEAPDHVFDLLAGVKSFNDTAARLKLLDLVIGVDTAVLHLAGALALDAWMMIPYAPDYRWLSEGSETVWYPTLKLFRQTARGDWDGVVKGVIEQLQRRVLSIE